MVVVRTDDLTQMSVHMRQPCACAHGPKKSTQQLSSTMSCFDELRMRRPPQCSQTPTRVSQRVQPWEHDCLLRDGTCETRSTCTENSGIDHHVEE